MSPLTALAALDEATRAIGLSEDLDDLIDSVLDQAGELVGFEHCALMLYDADHEELRVERARGYGDRRAEILELTLGPGEGISGVAVREKRPVRIGDVRRDPRYVEGLPDARSNLAVPLIVAGRVAGVINVESSRADAFTEKHERLLTILGSQAALAIVASRARKRMRERVQQLDALHRISRLTSRHHDLEETLHEMLHLTLELVPEGQVAFLLLDRESEVLRVRAAAGYKEGVEDLVIPVGEGVTGRCVTLGQPVVVEDVTQEDGYILGVPGGRSELAVPLMADDEVIGVLDVESTRPAAYGTDEVNFLSVVAQQAAAVLQTVRLHEQTRELAVTDPLTGLHNRRYFLDELEEHLRRAKRYDEPLSLLLVDCDLLKGINDRFGHLSGDRTLERIASLLRSSLRETDEVARIGGDEFAALLLQSDRETIREVTDRVQDGLRASPVSLQGEEVWVTVSMGAARYPEDGKDARTLLRRADQALYQAKRTGRDQLSLYEDLGASGDVPVAEPGEVGSDPA